jgi:HSP90 family molecular chaperone
MSQQVETMKFHAEIYQLMTTTINSFYEKVIFRELILNCLDAYDKIRCESLKNAEVSGKQKELKIDILSDKEKEHISITDAGIEKTTV